MILPAWFIFNTNSPIQFSGLKPHIHFSNCMRQAIVRVSYLSGFRGSILMWEDYGLKSVPWPVGFHVPFRFARPIDHWCHTTWPRASDSHVLYHSLPALPNADHAAAAENDAGLECSTATKTLICPGWETAVVPVSQPGTPVRDKRGCPFVPGLATGTKCLFFFMFFFSQFFFYFNYTFAFQLNLCIGIQCVWSPLIYTYIYSYLYNICPR